MYMYMCVVMISLQLLFNLNILWIQLGVCNISASVQQKGLWFFAIVLGLGWQAPPYAAHDLLLSFFPDCRILTF